MGDKRFVNELNTVLKIQYSLQLMCKDRSKYRYCSRDYIAIGLRSKQSEMFEISSSMVIVTMQP
jgi:hypothetical protein